MAMIGLTGTATLRPRLACIGAGLLLAIVAWYALGRRQERTGQPSPRLLIGLLLCWLPLGWAGLLGTPLVANVPERRGFNFAAWLPDDA